MKIKILKQKKNLGGTKLVLSIFYSNFIWIVGMKLKEIPDKIWINRNGEEGVSEVQFCTTERPQLFDLKWQLVEHVG